MWQPIEHLAIIAAGHATRGCHGHHRADHRCCSDQAFRESKHQRAKPARGRAASRGCCFAPRSGVGAWRWTERHDGRPQRVTAAALQPLTRTLISLQPLLGFWSRARAALRCTGPALLLLLFVGDAGGARARTQVAWRGVARSEPLNPLGPSGNAQLRTTSHIQHTTLRLWPQQSSYDRVLYGTARGVCSYL